MTDDNRDRYHATETVNFRLHAWLDAISDWRTGKSSLEDVKAARERLDNALTEVSRKFSKPFLTD